MSRATRHDDKKHKFEWEIFLPLLLCDEPLAIRIIPRQACMAALRVMGPTCVERQTTQTSYQHVANFLVNSYKYTI